jgi:hypothetical protein
VRVARRWRCVVSAGAAAVWIVAVFLAVTVARHAIVCWVQRNEDDAPLTRVTEAYTSDDPLGASFDSIVQQVIVVDVDDVRYRYVRRSSNDQRNEDDQS